MWQKPSGGDSFQRLVVLSKRPQINNTYNLVGFIFLLLFLLLTQSETNSWKPLFCLSLCPHSGARSSEVISERLLQTEPRNAGWTGTDSNQCITAASSVPQSFLDQSLLWSQDSYVNMASLRLLWWHWFFIGSHIIDLIGVLVWKLFFFFFVCAGIKNKSYREVGIYSRTDVLQLCDGYITWLTKDRDLCD